MKRMNTTRRDFLKCGAAFASAAALPVLADNPALFPGRGCFERLSLVSQHIDAGAEKPFSLLHISDTHLTAAYPHEGEWTRQFMSRRSKTFGGRQEEALRDSLGWAKEHVDYIVHTGDLIDGQSEANFDGKLYAGNPLNWQLDLILATLSYWQHSSMGSVPMNFSAMKSHFDYKKLIFFGGN